MPFADLAPVLFLNSVSTPERPALAGYLRVVNGSWGSLPLVDRKTTTLVAAMRLKMIFAPLKLDDQLDRNVFGAWVEQKSIRELIWGDIVICNDQPEYKSVGIHEILVTVGAKLLFLLPCRLDT